MPLEMLVGLNVTNDEAYSAYRAEMAPILDLHGGSFGYDFKVAEVLKSESEAPINRVFTIRFPDDSSMSAFFTNEEYLEVKVRHFDRSVSDTVIISFYEPR